MKNRIILLLLTMLGFSASACKEEEVTMYGTPHVNLKIIGKVSDANGAPIPGIQVQAMHIREKEVLTATDGSYELSGRGFSTQEELLFSDIDGAANGGEFVDKTLKIKFTEAERTEAGKSWYEGGFAKSGVDITLDKKQ